MKSVCVLARGETKFATKTCKTARRDLSSLSLPFFRNSNDKDWEIISLIFSYLKILFLNLHFMRISYVRHDIKKVIEFHLHVDDHIFLPFWMSNIFQHLRLIKHASTHLSHYGIWWNVLIDFSFKMITFALCLWPERA